MKQFLRENLLWILAPVVIVGVLVIGLMIWGGGNEGEAPFVYSLF